MNSVAAIEPQNLIIIEAAKLLNLSRNTISRMIGEDRFPAPTSQVGIKRLWDREELLAWSRAGMPSRRDWDVIRGRAAPLAGTRRSRYASRARIAGERGAT
jgi:excisionase family DNA binding protein